MDPKVGENPESDQTGAVLEFDVAMATSGQSSVTYGPPEEEIGAESYEAELTDWLRFLGIC